MIMKLNVAAKDIAFGANVLDIEVPKVLNEKFATGLEYIDLALGGLGFTPSTVTLFTGTPGAGKTTMMLTLADRISKEGGIALFNTAEESLFQTSMTAKRLRLKHGFMTGNTADVEELLKGCREIMEANPEEYTKEALEAEKRKLEAIPKGASARQTKDKSTFQNAK